jgi:hypothetical protein
MGAVEDAAQEGRPWDNLFSDDRTVLWLCARSSIVQPENLPIRACQWNDLDVGIACPRYTRRDVRTRSPIEGSYSLENSFSGRLLIPGSCVPREVLR